MYLIVLGGNPFSLYVIGSKAAGMVPVVVMQSNIA